MVLPARVCGACILVLLLGLVNLATGCGLLGKSGPEEARLSIQGASGEQLRMITSSLFLTSRIQDVRDDGSIVDSTVVVILDADTSTINIPFDSTYNIRVDQRFYVRLVRATPEEDRLNARLWIDDDLKFSTPPNDSRDSLQFIYSFRGPPGQEETEV